MQNPGIVMGITKPMAGAIDSHGACAIGFLEEKNIFVLYNSLQLIHSNICPKIYYCNMTFNVPVILTSDQPITL